MTRQLASTLSTEPPGPPGPPMRRRPRHWSGRARRDFFVFLALALPNLVLIAVFTYRPLISNIYYSTLDWTLGSASATVVGLDNYVTFFSSNDATKVLGTTADFVKKYPNTARAVTAAILEASKWIDASLQNKMKMAETVADKSYIHTSVDAINQRILGRYQNGLGRTWDDPNHMKFYNDGLVNFPYLSDGMWFITQHKRWGLIKEHPDYLAIAKQVNRIDVYKDAAAATKTPLPKDVMRTSKLIDGVVWDGKDPKKYADSFQVHA